MDLTWAPEELVKEVLEQIREDKHGKLNRKRPTRKDLMKIIAEVLKEDPRPQDFVDMVYELLEARGFNTRFTSVKRIWKVYETMVRKGFIDDVMGVCGKC